MVPHSTLETIAILRRTLEEIEKDLDPALDASSFNDLKQIVLRRIAELELRDVGHESMRGASGASGSA